eukprot:SAG11_NODE_181_length_13239_cov_10.587139_3_plen_190_part_00
MQIIITKFSMHVVPDSRCGHGIMHHAAMPCMSLSCMHTLICYRVNNLLIISAQSKNKTEYLCTHPALLSPPHAEGGGQIGCLVSRPGQGQQPERPLHCCLPLPHTPPRRHQPVQNRVLVCRWSATWLRLRHSREEDSPGLFVDSFRGVHALRPNCTPPRGTAPFRRSQVEGADCTRLPLRGAGEARSTL